MDKNIKLLSLKTFTGKPFDAVETTMASVFGRLSAVDFTCDVPSLVPLEKSGALQRHGKAPKLSEIMNGKYDILFGVGRPHELLAALVRPKKTKYIIHYQSILLKKSEPAWRVRMPWLLRKFIFSQADLVLSPSNFSASTVRELFPKMRVEYVLNGIDTIFFHPSRKNLPYLREKYGIDISRPLVVFVGTLQERKRPDVFIEIARRVPEANFIAVGRATDERDFLKGTAEISNFRHITLMPRDDIAIFLASSKAFIFPSIREPAALVILEAMASGAVPLLSQSGGNIEFLHDGESGFLISYDDQEIDTFITTLKRLLDDDSLQERFSSTARREAEAHTWNAATKEYERIFRSLIN